MATLNRTLLVVCPEGPALRVFTCVTRFWRWSLGRAEVVALPTGESQPEAIAAAIRPLVLRWGIAPGTEVALVLPAVTGGMLTLGLGPGLGAAPQGRGARVDAAWLERELSGRIPFALKDIEYEAQSNTGANAGTGTGERSIQLSWVPRTVAAEFRTAFARLGLTLGEMLFRAQLYAADERAGPNADRGELLIERWNGWCSFHLLAGGRVLRTSMAQTPDSRAFADRLRLELLSYGNTGGNRGGNKGGNEVGDEGRVASASDARIVSRIVLAGSKGQFDSEFETAAKNAAARTIEIERRTTDLSGMFVRFWGAGGTGIWLPPENPPALAMVRRIAYAVAGLGALLAAAMTWDASAIRDEIASLEARETRLRPQYQTLVARERQAAAALGTADAVARLSAAPGEPQAALLAVFNALPRSAWVTRFSFEGSKVTVAGKGADTESVIADLKDQAGVSRIAAAPGDLPEIADGTTGRTTGQSFRVLFQWAPTDAAGGRVAATGPEAGQEPAAGRAARPTAGPKAVHPGPANKGPR